MYNSFNLTVFNSSSLELGIKPSKCALSYASKTGISEFADRPPILDASTTYIGSIEPSSLVLKIRISF